jgi:glycerone phosphate O-acyltransferase
MEFVKLDFDGNDLSFLLKSYNPDKSKRAQGLTTDQINNTVLQNQKLKDLIKKISHEWEGNAEKTAEEIVYEIGHLMTLPAVRTTALLLRVPIRHIIDGIYINKNGLEQLSMYVSTQPVVLMPSHRSYLDFLLVSYVMFEHNIQIPAIAAAQDFMNMKFVTSLLRRCGAFFMRRSFASDQLYKLIFTLYLQTILCSYDMPIEFFIEGTRSRTAKSLHPRLG